MKQTINGKPGDLIEIFRKGYQHWAVYIGENEVVHFTSDGVQSFGSLASLSSSNGEVKCEKFTDVVGKHRFKVNNLLDSKYKARDPSVIVDEACDMVGHELLYNLYTFNCEHFATKMRNGKAVSLQVENNVWNAIVAFALVIGGLVTGGLVTGRSRVARGVVVLAIVVFVALILSRSRS